LFAGRFEIIAVRPFDVSSAFMLIARLLKKAPELPASKNSEVPPALDALILRLLAKEPAARPATASELASLLSKVTVFSHASR
jgi:serine/threonine-protein kinase